MIHKENSELSGKEIILDSETLKSLEFKSEEEIFIVEDWWDKVANKSWMFSRGNPACLNYAMRAALKGLPLDDKVLYGKINGLGYLIHISEIQNNKETKNGKE